MKVHLAVYRAISGADKRYERFASNVRRNGNIKGWSATRKFEVGDLVFFYFGAPIKSIVAIGFVATPPRPQKGLWDWTNKTRTAFCNFDPIWHLKSTEPLKEISHRLGLHSWYRAFPYRRSREIKPKIAHKLLFEITRSNPEIQERISSLGIDIPKQIRTQGITSYDTATKFFEGGVKEIVLELQSRNRYLRNQAVAIYGQTCRVCGFNFEKFYGNLGAGYIEVHHLNPLSQRKTTRQTTIEDVDVVCANCHRILHRNGKQPLSIDELRRAIRKKRSKT